MKSMMRIIFLLQSFILFYFFSSCDNVEVKKNTIEQNSKKSDSVKRMHNAIYLFDKAEMASIDSIKKYQLTEISDTCLKYFYVVNYKRRFKESLWCKDSSLTIGESEVKPIGFVNNDLDQKQILFGVFLNDSIPCSIQLNATDDEMLSGFIVSVKKKKIIDVLVGQNTKMNFTDFKFYYDSIAVSDDFKSYLHSKNGRIHPVFKNLLFP